MPWLGQAVAQSKVFCYRSFAVGSKFDSQVTLQASYCCAAFGCVGSPERGRVFPKTHYSTSPSEFDGCGAFLDESSAALESFPTVEISEFRGQQSEQFEVAHVLGSREYR